MSDTLEDLKAELRSLTVEQLAEVTGIEPWRIYQMVKKGDVPAVSSDVKDEDGAAPAAGRRGGLKDEEESNRDF